MFVNFRSPLALYCKVLLNKVSVFKLPPLSNRSANKTKARYTYELARQLCSHSSKESLYEKRYKHEEDEAMKIESSLFEQSSIKYEPVDAQEVLMKSKIPNLPKQYKRELIKTAQPTTPSLVSPKKTREERESKSRIIKDTELGLEYLKLDLNDPRLTTLMITARSKKRRDKQCQIVVEGRRLILDALVCGLKLNTILFSQKDQLADIKQEVVEALKRFPQMKIYKVPHHDMKKWSTLTTPPGVMTLFERPSQNYIAKQLTAPLPLTVVCDNIREPNNLGSIIRTCAALPCFQIIVTKGCCDPWESKALRGGCGGHFRVPIRDNIDWQELSMLIPPEVAHDCCVFIAESNIDRLKSKESNITEYCSIEKTGSHNLVIIGGETHGVSEAAYRFLSMVGPRGSCLNIPIAEGCDSLNVASALTLILFELRKSILKADEETLLSSKS
ncbi:rRNA methyltransferase 3, mitochondrial [Stomoxys calcitrans]|uniref:rRNA methyltransferase 3, mitochondrial n=1 Tax=Stomoxys calcitrans TaxID=35570 RepID=UPI0027E36F5D|nr:rRNA methyltransferase 3, mitochondrial [Stomoxys calcitrans]